MDFQKKAEEVWDYCLAYLRETHSTDVVENGADPPSVITAFLKQAYKEGVEFVLSNALRLAYGGWQINLYALRGSCISFISKSIEEVPK